MLDLLFVPSLPGVNTCLLTVRIKLTSSFPGRQELSDVVTAGCIALMGIWIANGQPKVSMAK